MIAQYPGQCCFCQRPITVGIDTYGKESRKNWHESCYEAQPPSAEQYALAQKLGFMSSDAAMHREWSKVRFQPEPERKSGQGTLSL